MKHELEPIGRSLIFTPSCKVTPLGVEWLREPTDDELMADDYTIQRCDESAGWWMGDMIVKLWQRSPKDKTLSQFASEYAAARDKNAQYAIDQACVCELFPIAERSAKPLTWSHHYIIFNHVGTAGTRTALRWLTKAAKGDQSGPDQGKPWSTGKLRAKLREHNSPEADEPTAPPHRYKELISFDGWAAVNARLAEEMDSATACRWLDDYSATARFVDAVRARACAATDCKNSKESIQAVAGQR